MNGDRPESDAELVPLAPGRTPRRWQAEAMRSIRAYLPKHRAILVSAATGCHAKGQLIMRYDGTTIPVEDVAVGDLLMGPDSTPRRVESLHRGQDAMFQITPVKGEPFTVNGDHVLSLIDTREESDANLRDVTVREWSKWRKFAKHVHKLVRTGVEYPAREHGPIPPYYLGMLIGDGTLSTGTVMVTKPDPEIRQACEELATMFGLRVSLTFSGGNTPTYRMVKITRYGRALRNPLTTALASLSLRCVGEKRRIPPAYLYAPRDDRMALLAGLLDTDGSLTGGGYDWLAKSRDLAGDVVTLARGLGLAAYLTSKTIYTQYGGGEYWRVSISGDCSKLPMRIPRKIASERKQIKSVLRTGFSVTPAGDGDYYGFTVDGDRRYLLGDFTITHNSGKGDLLASLIVKAARRGKRCLFLVHRDELIDDVMARALAIEPALYAGKVKGAQNEINRHAVFASVQSLQGKRLETVGRFDFYFTDECFPAGTPIRMADGSEKAIEDVAIGDHVLSFDRPAGVFVRGLVTETRRQRAAMFVDLTIGERVITCTPSHPFLTRRGWVAAGDLTTDDEVRIAHETNDVRQVRQGVAEADEACIAAPVLRSVYRRTGDRAETAPAVLELRDGGDRVDSQSGLPRKQGAGVLQRRVQGRSEAPRVVGTNGTNEPGSRERANEGTQPDARRRDAASHEGHDHSDRAQTSGARWQRETSDTSRAAAFGGPGLADECSLPAETRQVCGLPVPLQDRHSERGPTGGDRNRRRIARVAEGSGGGSQETSISDFARVDRVAVYKPGRDGPVGRMRGPGAVYNFGVDRFHTYVANGVVVHNCHHSGAASYRKLYARIEEVNPRAKHIGFTATPFRNAGQGKTKGIGDVFEVLAYEYSLQDAINDGALCPIRCLRIETELDLSGVDPDDEDRVAKMVDTPERNAVAVQKYLEHGSTAGGLAPAIAFCANVQHAINLAELLRASGVRAEAVWDSYLPAGQPSAPEPDEPYDGPYPDEADERGMKIKDKPKRKAVKCPDRAGRIAAYQRGDLDVLTNANLLTEGFDAPATRIVMLLRPTQSRGMFCQMVGRATRLSPGKAEGLILDFVANSESHDLASMADLTRPTKGVRIEVGATVRHRRLAELSEGVVTAIWSAEPIVIAPPVEPDEEDLAPREPEPADPELDYARVLWRNAGDFERGEDSPDQAEGHTHRCRELVILRPPRTITDLDIEPRVIGVSEFTVTLFGDPDAPDAARVGWYNYTTSKKEHVLITRGDGMAVLLQHAPARGSAPPEWEAWMRCEGPTPHDIDRPPESLERIASGEFHAVRTAASAMIRNPIDWKAGWLRDEASERQIDALAKFGMKQGRITRGEASMLLELRIMRMLIQKATRPWLPRHDRRIDHEQQSARSTPSDGNAP